jgi:hypothetical protein
MMQFHSGRECFRSGATPIQAHTPDTPIFDEDHLRAKLRSAGSGVHAGTAAPKHNQDLSAVPLFDPSYTTRTTLSIP